MHKFAKIRCPYGKITGKDFTGRFNGRIATKSDACVTLKYCKNNCSKYHNDCKRFIK